MADGFRLDLDEDAIDDLLHSEDAEDLAQLAGDVVADNAARLAPKATGAGAASIHAQTDEDEDGFYADVSWDKDHFYMDFHERGSVHQPPRPFLVPGMEQSGL